MLTEGLRLEDSPCRDRLAQPHVPMAGEPTATRPAPSGSGEQVLAGTRAGGSREMPVPRILRPVPGSASRCQGSRAQGAEPTAAAIPGGRAAPAHSGGSTHPATAQDGFPVNKFISSGIWDSCK